MSAGAEILRPVIRRLVKAPVFIKRLPVSPIPENALLTEDDAPLLTEDDQNLTDES